MFDTPTAESWYAKFYKTAMSRMEKDGVTYPASTAMDLDEPPTSSEETLSHLNDVSMQAMSQKGYDAMEGEFTNPDTNSKGRLFEFIRESEGERLDAYKDHKGNVTVGVGFNMDADGARERFEQALPTVDFDAVYNGDTDLLPSQSRVLFDTTIGEYEKVVDNKLGDVPMREHERMALVSLASNSPSLIGPNLVSKMKAGDTNGVIDEILNRSNKHKHQGIQARRKAEARMFAGRAEGVLTP